GGGETTTGGGVGTYLRRIALHGRWRRARIIHTVILLTVGVPIRLFGPNVALRRVTAPDIGIRDTWRKQSKQYADSDHRQEVHGALPLFSITPPTNIEGRPFT